MLTLYHRPIHVRFTNKILLLLFYLFSTAEQLIEILLNLHTVVLLPPLLHGVVEESLFDVEDFGDFQLDIYSKSIQQTELVDGAQNQTTYLVR